MSGAEAGRLADKAVIVTGGTGEPGPGYVHRLIFPKPKHQTSPYAH